MTVSSFLLPEILRDACSFCGPLRHYSNGSSLTVKNSHTLLYEIINPRWDRVAYTTLLSTRIRA